VINFGANVTSAARAAHRHLFSLPIWLIAGAIGLRSSSASSPAAIRPSRAAKLDPIQALRHD